jgi:hypothetical protein
MHSNRRDMNLTATTLEGALTITDSREPEMDGRREWDVSLTIAGAISVKRAIEIDVMKGSRHPFLTTVRISGNQNGLDLRVVSQSRDRHGAAQSALFFVGEMLNVLTLRVNIPLHLSLADTRPRPVMDSVKMLVERDEWVELFSLGRNYGQERPVFSRALSWYRKGLNSEDPIDKLLAIWLSLEVIGKSCGRNIKISDSEIVNRISDCFNHVWGQPQGWQVIPNGLNQFQQIKAHRNAIAHGNFHVTPEKLQEISDEVPRLQEVARAFLIEWERRPDGDRHL